MGGGEMNDWVKTNAVQLILALVAVVAFFYQMQANHGETLRELERDAVLLKGIADRIDTLDGDVRVLRDDLAEYHANNTGAHSEYATRLTHLEGGGLR